MKYLNLTFLLAGHICLGQFGGYQSLELPIGARNAALGGYVVSLTQDVTQFMHNPATLELTEPTDLAVTYSPYFSDIMHFTGAYSTEFQKLGKMAFGISYLDYGDFVETDPTGASDRTFGGADYLLAVGKSHTISSFSVGATLKFAQSVVESYGSSAILMDIGGLYKYPDGDFAVGMVFKNFGVRLSEYVASNVTRLPFDVQLGVSVKPEHMPFRFTLTGYNLLEQDLYFDSDESQSVSRTVKVFDSFFRRVNLGTELIFSKNVQLLFGYSHLRQRELRFPDSGGGAGFSFGFLIGTKKIKLRYAHSTYHAAGGANFFTLYTNLHSFKKVI